MMFIMTDKIIDSLTDNNNKGLTVIGVGVFTDVQLNSYVTIEDFEGYTMLKTSITGAGLLKKLLKCFKLVLFAAPCLLDVAFINRLMAGDSLSWDDYLKNYLQVPLNDFLEKTSLVASNLNRTAAKKNTGIYGTLIGVLGTISVSRISEAYPFLDMSNYLKWVYINRTVPRLESRTKLKES